MNAIRLFNEKFDSQKCKEEERKKEAAFLLCFLQLSNESADGNGQPCKYGGTYQGPVAFFVHDDFYFSGNNPYTTKQKEQDTTDE